MPGQMPSIPVWAGFLASSWLRETRGHLKFKFTAPGTGKYTIHGTGELRGRWCAFKLLRASFHTCTA